MNIEAVGSSRSPIVAASEEGKDASFMQQLKATIVRNWLRKMRNRRQAFRVSLVILSPGTDKNFSSIYLSLTGQVRGHPKVVLFVVTE